MSASDYYENVILDALLDVAGNYVGLSTADPLDDASGLAEPSGNGYARVEITAAGWAAASGGSKATDVALEFPAATGNWGTVTHFAIFDAVTGGNMLISAALTASKTISSGQTPRFPAGDLAVTQG